MFSLILKRNKRGEWSAYRLFLSPDKSSISWESHENAKRYLLSSLALSDLTQVVFEPSGLNESQCGDCAIVELQCDNKRICFKYELTSDHVRFVSTLYRLVDSVAAIREVEPVIANQARQIDAPACDPTKASETKVNANFSSGGSDSLLGSGDLEKFKLRLQEGFLVEKVRV